MAVSYKIARQTKSTKNYERIPVARFFFTSATRSPEIRRQGSSIAELENVDSSSTSATPCIIFCQTRLTPFERNAPGGHFAARDASRITGKDLELSGLVRTPESDIKSLLANAQIPDGQLPEP